MLNWLTGIHNCFFIFTNGSTEGEITKSKFLKETLTVTKVSDVFVIKFYISFLTNLLFIKNKRQLNLL